MIKEISNLLKKSKGITILTGSGVSAESGIPTFRDAQIGLWAEFKPEELASMSAFQKNPQMVWDWYQWRRQLVAEAKPNKAHMVIAEMQKQLPNVRLITQNVDGLHHQAGSVDVIEFHGNIMTDKCDQCLHVQENYDNTTTEIPHCPMCRSVLRPGVVWFGEGIPARASKLSILAAKNCDLFFSIGTSSLVHPAAGLAEIAKANGAKIIEINPNATPLTSRADYVLAESASTALQKLSVRLFDQVRT